MLPRPGAVCAPVFTRYWFRIESTPAKNEADEVVLPHPQKVPFAMVRYGSWSHEAANEMSGTSRALILGTPSALCHSGIGKITLAPPPEADSPWPWGVEFHTVSGI